MQASSNLLQQGDIVQLFFVLFVPFLFIRVLLSLVPCLTSLWPGQSRPKGRRSSLGQAFDESYSGKVPTNNSSPRKPGQASDASFLSGKVCGYTRAFICTMSYASYYSVSVCITLYSVYVTCRFVLSCFLQQRITLFVVCCSPQLSLCVCC